MKYENLARDEERTANFWFDERQREADYAARMKK
jgi:hypothetical protein